MVYTPTLGQDENEPWSYANILAIYHVIVRTASNTEPQQLTVLWVRWMQRNEVGLTGLNSRNFTRVSFVPWSGIPGSTFDFVDPSHVIRACHLIPAFNLGRTYDLLEPSFVRDPKGDWYAYYANRYGLGLSLIETMTHLHRTGSLIGMHSQGSPGSGLGVNAFRLPKFSTSG